MSGLLVGLWQVLQRERWGLVVGAGSFGCGYRARTQSKITGVAALRAAERGWSAGISGSSTSRTKADVARPRPVANHALLRTRPPVGNPEKEGGLPRPKRVAEAIGPSGCLASRCPDWGRRLEQRPMRDRAARLAGDAGTAHQARRTGRPGVGGGEGWATHEALTGAIPPAPPGGQPRRPARPWKRRVWGWWGLRLGKPALFHAWA